MGDRVVTFEEMEKFANSKDVLIIDVREPDEVNSTGKIGDSIHIPLGELENALKSLDEEEFKNKYHVPRSLPDFPIVFSCKLGGRAEKAMKIVLGHGFSKFILILDNAPAHPSSTELNEIDAQFFVVYLAPNVTSLIQPMDQGVISALKRRYKTMFLNELLAKEF
ncbi:hypothetical protein NQ318_010930 [Aromia moschata]|uniref:Rhodanese domain-containing protein n=1 Tax=Aromia moschata TaxID=1265417 RepID=A0AAV8XFT5_9CUCU|nr:hypothetical protein NQ318_010930 [Aromia moschata]